MQPFDLTRPEYNPDDCPEWARVRHSEWLMPFIGVNGAPLTYQRANGKPYATNVRGIDLYQANQFIWYVPETSRFLYHEYTPLKVDYVKGTLPGYERASAAIVDGIDDPAARAEALLLAMPSLVRHPSMPPLCGEKTPSNRNLEDEALLASGTGWCNEQARVFVRLCQVNGIPARIIHLFGQSHTVAEFFAGGRWALADASNLFVTRDEQGRLMSAAECHDQGDGQAAYARAKQAAMQRLAAMSDAELGFDDPAAARKFRANAEAFDAETLAGREDLAFGVINYPLPR